MATSCSRRVSIRHRTLIQTCELLTTLNFSILLPTIGLKRLSLVEINNLTSDQKNSREKKTFPKYKCQECHEKFVFKAELSRHSLKVHYQGEKFKCECGKLHKCKSSIFRCRSSHKSSENFSCKVHMIKNLSVSLTTILFFPLDLQTRV